MIIRDITERKRAADSIRESEEQYRGLVELSPDSILIEQDGTIAFINQAGLKLFGAAHPEQILGRQILDLIHPDYRKIVKKQFQSIRTKKKELPLIEEKFLRLDGSSIDVEVAATPFVQEGKLGVQVIVHDISERKQAEEKLSASEAELRALFAAMQDVVMVVDQEGVYRKIAPTLPGLLSCSPEELLGKKLADVFPPEEARRFLGAVRRVLKTGQTDHIEYQLTINDRPVWFSAFITPMTADSTVWVARDITEQKQAEDEIRHLNANLEKRVEERTHELREAQEQLVRHEKLAALGQLAGGVGHELRNPLGIIRSAIYYLKLIQPDASVKIQDYHALIEQEVLNADKIVNDLLDFARIKPADREQVSVIELVQRVLARYPIPESVTTLLKLPANLPKVFADPGHLDQVLGNLIVNAHQAMVEGGKLTISASVQNDFMAIAVKDTGTGITPEHKKKIFEPLFTTKARELAWA